MLHSVPTRPLELPRWDGRRTGKGVATRDAYGKALAALGTAPR